MFCLIPLLWVWNRVHLSHKPCFVIHRLLPFLLTRVVSLNSPLLVFLLSSSSEYGNISLCILVLLKRQEIEDILIIAILNEAAFITKETMSLFHTFSYDIIFSFESIL